MHKKLIKINILIILLAISIIFPVFATSAKKKVWYLTYPIYINESIDGLKWANWANQPWCKGSGTEDDPYMIKDLTIEVSGSVFAMMIEGSSAYFKIMKCTFRNIGGEGTAALILLGTQNGVIFKNTFYGSNTGIALIGSENNVVQKNLCYENTAVGIYNRWGMFNNIKQNDCKNNENGIVIESAHKTIIEKNDCTGNGLTGIALITQNEENTPKDNIIYANKVENNQVGIYLGDADKNDIIRNTVAQNTYGIMFDNGSQENTVYHNNIIDNVVQAVDFQPWTNNWHHPYMLEGNYWSDYTGMDSDGDGIGDTEWPEIGFDAYPFMVENGWDIFTAKEEEILNAFLDPDSNRFPGQVQATETIYLIFGMKQGFSERINGLFFPPYTAQFLFFGEHEMQGSLWYFDEIVGGEPGLTQFFYIVFPPNFFTDIGFPLGWYEFYIQVSLYNDGVQKYETIGPYYFELI